jgi:hypothetical protein
MFNCKQFYEPAYRMLVATCNFSNLSRVIAIVITKISIENAIHCGAFLSWFEEMNLGLAWTAWM